MYPHERSLVTRMKDRPFAILGVNSDGSAGTLRAILAENKLPWRNWVDGDTDGPIGRAWNVSAWPTTYLIDHRGVIRGRDLYGEALDRMVDELVLEAERAQAVR
ncbi:MAG: TlpA family protein disulfide reductase [Planctomycetaceae bacterium]